MTDTAQSTEQGPAKAKSGKGKGKSTSPKTELVALKASALSTDIGPLVVAGLAKAETEREKLTQGLHNVESKRYDLLAKTTQAIVKAAKADGNIDLSAAFGGTKPEMNKLSAQIGLALGLREIAQVGKGDKAKPRLVMAKAVVKFFPSKGDKPDDPATIRKNTFRTNFSHLLKKCIQTAYTIIDKNIEMRVEPQSGTLQLSGPAIAKTFGQSKVTLNEKQVVQDGNTAVKLEQKPSYTAVAAMSATAHQAAHVGRRGVGGAVATSTDPQVALQSICKTLVQALEKLGNATLTEPTKEALRSVESAVDNALD